MRNLSKSKLLAYRQCPKRLWLEIHTPERRKDSKSTEAIFRIGHQVGDIARSLYDPENKGILIDPFSEGFSRAFSRTKKLLTTDQPIFEAGFCAGGALAFADVMLPIKQRGKTTWRMIEVKSSTSVKDYYRDDAAIQAYVAKCSGVALDEISLAHIDSHWVYPGGDNYSGLLVEKDLTSEAFAREAEVKVWISEASRVANSRSEPRMSTGSHCSVPYDCGFYDHCKGHEEKPIYPVTWLPRIHSKSLRDAIEKGARDLREIPDEALTEKQLRVKYCTLSNRVYFDEEASSTELAKHELPAYFIDFETVQFAVPFWEGTAPFQQIPFQFSCHYMSDPQNLTHESFIDISGNDPSKSFIESLLDTCGDSGPIFVYNAAFEKSRIKELANRYLEFKQSLLAISDRMVDLLTIVEKYYYHPDQHGSWRIKKVLPTIAPNLGHYGLNNIQNGIDAMAAFIEANSPETSLSAKEKIENDLIDYCFIDTYAMVCLWKLLSGRYGVNSFLSHASHAVSHEVKHH